MFIIFVKDIIIIIANYINFLNQINLILFINNYSFVLYYLYIQYLFLTVYFPNFKLKYLLHLLRKIFFTAVVNYLSTVFVL